MAQITTKTGVANLTATLLKVEEVTSIDPADKGSKFARLANRWMDTVRREVLREHIWNCALKRQQLPADGTDPTFGYSKRFLLPADYIRVATLGDEDNPETDYKIEAGYLHCNLTAPIDLRFIFDQTDVSTWDADLLMCVAAKLAHRLAYSMTGNRSMVDEMKMEYAQALSDAKGIDGQESPPTHKVQRSRWKAMKEGYSTAGSVYRGRVVT